MSGCWRDDNRGNSAQDSSGLRGKVPFAGVCEGDWKRGGVIEVAAHEVSCASSAQCLLTSSRESCPGMLS